MKIKKGDKVKIITGKDKGKTGTVLQAFPKHNKVSIEGINLMIKNVRARREGEKGQKIQYPAPMNESNVLFVCPKCNKAARLSYKVLENKKKARTCNKCKEII